MVSKIRTLIHSFKNILMLTSKPTREEFMLMFKVVLAGLFLVGTYGFIIQLTAIGIETIRGIFIPQILLLVITGVIGFAMLVYYYGRRKGKW